MEKILFILICLLTIFLLFGCTSSPEDLIKEKKELKPFFDAHPDAELKSITKLSQEEFKKEKASWEESCGKQINSGAYYVTIYEEGSDKLQILAETGNLEIICIVEGELSQIVPPPNNNEPLAECDNNLDCFIENSKNCVSSKWTSAYNTKFEIRGMQDGKCTVYRDFTKDECPFEKTDLTAMLERWKIENYSTEDWETCESNFVEILPPDENQPCEENWSCNPWTTCSNDSQTRTCMDFTQCGTDTNKPIENQTCVSKPEPCTENWSCGNWSTCTNSSQTRSCTDASSCETTTNKPTTTQSCTETCTENWSCGTWSDCTNSSQSRTCTDASACGTTTSKPTESQSCESASAHIINMIITKNTYLVDETISEYKLTFETTQDIDVLILNKFVEDSSGETKYGLRYESLGGSGEPKSTVSFLLAYTFSGGGYSSGNSFGKAGTYTLYGAAYDCSVVATALGKSCSSIESFADMYGDNVEALQNLVEDTEYVTVAN